MMKSDMRLKTMSDEIKWLTITEAVEIANKLRNIKFTAGDIYRRALYGNINLSIYFQSPVILRKIQTSNTKIKLKPVNESLINRFCFLEKNCFLNDRKLIVSTDGKYIYPTQQILDTALTGFEYVWVQRLLAHTLGIPLPVLGENRINYGITVNFGGNLFQIFEKMTWSERIKLQIARLPMNISSYLTEQLHDLSMEKYYAREYFPQYHLPQDACFVIRHAELAKLINPSGTNNNSSQSSSRISTPLSRLFWLACKNNEIINPLISQPYKLLSIFEQWAIDAGISDRLSGDTLKNALERGSPTSISTKNK
ncbi:hypothetical protein [Kosakonia sp. YIM B13611]|uniref:hypothetical protein n=1 Tax=unclassified Kosakonia TaxID=2632876 RepID=UPI0036810C94